MVELRGLTRKFGEFVAVNDLRLQVSQGTIFGFLGTNGAGKSTTVKMLTGILKPSAGDALIDGLSIQTSPLEIQQKIGVLPEDLALFDSLTIWEHLKMCGAIYGLRNSETETRAEQLRKRNHLFALEEDVCECEKRHGEPKTVEPVRQYGRAGEIRVPPKMIEQRVVRPVVMTSIVQVQESGGCANSYHVRQILIPQHSIHRNDARRHKNYAGNKYDAVDEEVSR
jgi:ABC-type dipeptide/oligopeptide/nickel transport system ATPase component